MKPLMRMRTQRRGFTLIELVITVAIVGILAAIAFPSYQAYVIRSNRTDAQQFLQQMTMDAERYFTRTNSYTDLGKYLSDSETAAEKTGIYNVAINETSAMSFNITATPVAGKINKDDGVLEIYSDGRKIRRVGGKEKSWTDRN